jgi:hypothetical protein
MRAERFPAHLLQLALRGLVHRMRRWQRKSEVLVLWMRGVLVGLLAVVVGYLAARTDVDVVVLEQIYAAPHTAHKVRLRPRTLTHPGRRGERACV